MKGGVPAVRLAVAAIRRIGAVVRLAVDEAVEATDPKGPGGMMWTDDEIDQVAEAIGEGVADMARDLLREILGRRGRRAS